MGRSHKRRHPHPVHRHYRRSKHHSHHHVHIGEIHDVDDWCVDNVFIKRGYRLDLNSWSKAFRSLFMLHNESVNVWSHLLGAIFFLCLLLYIMFNAQGISAKLDLGQYNSEVLRDAFDERFSSAKLYLDEMSQYDFKQELYNGFESIKQRITEDFQPPDLDYLRSQLTYMAANMSERAHNALDNVPIAEIRKHVDGLRSFVEEHSLLWPKQGESDLATWPLCVFVTSAIICLTCSATCHLLAAMSEKMWDFVVKLDYAGISILIAGSNYPVIYYIFYCKSGFTWFYLLLNSGVSLIVFVVTLLPGFIHPQAKYARGAIFAGLGIFCSFPLLHFFTNYEEYIEFMPSIPYFVIMGMAYLFGATMYSVRVPERCSPGTFCIFGNSHQIFHLMVITGALIHYFGCIDAYNIRENTQCAS